MGKSCLGGCGICALVSSRNTSSAATSWARYLLSLDNCERHRGEHFNYWEHASAPGSEDLAKRKAHFCFHTVNFPSCAIGENDSMSVRDCLASEKDVLDAATGSVEQCRFSGRSKGGVMGELTAGGFQDVLLVLVFQ